PTRAHPLPYTPRFRSGGLHRNALHEIRGETTRDSVTATGFATAILARLAAVDDRPFLWVIEEMAAREGGFPHGPGLDGFGLDPRERKSTRLNSSHEKT